MNNEEISKAYEPQAFEDNIYSRWEKSGFFNPDNLPVEIRKEKRETRKEKRVERGAEREKNKDKNSTGE